MGGGSQGGPQGPLASSRGWRGPVRRAQDVAALKEQPPGGGHHASSGAASSSLADNPSTRRFSDPAPSPDGDGDGKAKGKKKGKEDGAGADAGAAAGATAGAVGAGAALDPEDGLDFAALYQRLWGDHGARGAVRTAATAGLLAIRVAATQRRQLEEAERAREREERKRVR